MKTRPTADEGEGDDSAEAGDNGDQDTYGGEQESEKTGTLDANGKLQIEVPTRVDSKKQDLVYRIEARVTDAGNREISGRGFALATYGSFFLTAAPTSYVYAKGDSATLNITAQNYDKQPVQTAFRVEMTAGPGARARAKPSPLRRARPTPAAKLKSSSGSLSRRIPRAGDRDHAGAARCGELRLSVGARPEPVVERPDRRAIQIVADKKTYQPGETAHVLIVTDKEPTSVLVTTEGNGLYTGQVIRSSGGSITVDVPIRPEYAPNVYIVATYIRNNKLYQGSKSLNVPPTGHHLNVELHSLEAAVSARRGSRLHHPGQRRRQRQARRAEFSLGVVDEAIYAISPDSTAAS